MKGSSFVFIVSAMVMILTSCSELDDHVKSNENELTSFVFNAEINAELAVNINGVINGLDIFAIVPYGTNVTALVATFTANGLSVAVEGNVQTSGVTANDFSNSVCYVVTAEDNSTKNYNVNVTFAAIPATESSIFNVSNSIGDSGIITLSESVDSYTMIYANDVLELSFPVGTTDAGAASLIYKFWIGQTEVTNNIVKMILQWAYHHGKFSDTVNDHNGFDATTVKYGGQELLDLDDYKCRIRYDGLGLFSVEESYNQNPVTNITWYGAVMLCNWLTEMRDGNTDEVVYTGIDTDWTHDETIESIGNTGYRLPTFNEWEYAARYRDNDSINSVSGYSEPCYTKGDSASGAIANYNDEQACQQVAVYGDYNDDQAVKSIEGSANSLGIYDMSGNVWEWVFTKFDSDDQFRHYRGGSYDSISFLLQIGHWTNRNPDDEFGDVGFRFCRTASY